MFVALYQVLCLLTMSKGRKRGSNQHGKDDNNMELFYHLLLIVCKSIKQLLIMVDLSLSYCNKLTMFPSSLKTKSQ